MNILRYTSILYISILAALLASCADEEVISYKEGKYQSTLRFNLAQPTTRNTAAEDVIDRLDILLFREGVLEKIMTNVTSLQQDEQGRSYVTISSDNEGLYTAYVFVNYDFPDLFEYLMPGNTTEKDILLIRTAILKKMPASPFIMYGIHNITFGKQSNATTCDLYHVVAKIDVRNKASNFELTSARLLRTKSSSVLFQQTPSTDVDVVDFAAEKAVEKKVALYAYENPLVEEAKATAVEITGLVNGKELTYTVHLEQNGKLIPLERNTVYTIYVNNVRSHSLEITMDVNPWIVGETMEEMLSGNKPVVEVNIDNALGQYSPADTTVTVLSSGGEFMINARANAACDIRTTESWIAQAPESRAPSFIDNNFRISVAPNTDSAPRTGYIQVFNKLNNLSQTLIVTQAAEEAGGDKYMVLVVAGQSNAVGYDQSALDAEDLNTPERALQLSYRQGAAPNKNLSIIPLSWCADDVDAYKRNAPNKSGQYGLKGIHLPLAKELLKYIPADYKIVMVPVAYSSSRFWNDGTAFGTYDPALMRPTIMSSRLRWGTSSAYRNTIVDRVKYLLDMDARNKFLGVVWCQGENDHANSDYHYAEFSRMAENILTSLSGYGNRSNYGVIDKRSWYNYSSCTYWVNWNSAEDASGVFGGYKVWNPDTFIHAPSDLPSNPDDGGPGMGKYHFGYNAFRTIARMVAERMNENGLLFNNAQRVSGHFTDKTTVAQAQSLGGSMTDADISSSLVSMLPLNTSVKEQTGKASIASYGAMSLVPAEGLKDLKGNARNRKALHIVPSDGFNCLKISSLPGSANWSISFMFKRTGRLNEDIQCLIYPDAQSKPFIGFKKYTSVKGVAGAAEFVVEPISQNTKKSAVPGQFLEADKVRTLDEWVHYTVTYNGSSKQTCVYMNGELVKKATVASSVASSFKSLYIGHVDSAFPSAEGLMTDLAIWNKDLTASTVKKIFLMNYYGYTK